MDIPPFGTVVESYLYDDSGIRVKKTVGSTNSYYPFAHYAPRGFPNGSTVIKYYFFAGMRIATKKGSTLYYLHTDQLGSVVLTNGLNQHQEYCAYGRKRAISGSTTTCGGSNTLTGTDHTFTGQQVDATGLMYYQSRYYDPEIGSFISPDTIVPDLTNLFDFNRYMMVRGNPLKFTDPTGHYSNDEIMQHFGCQDWGCVESSFGEGGSHAGMWGWLYILQEARNGDTLRARGISTNSYAEMSGTFQMAANGRIELHGGSYISGAGTHQFSGAISEAAYVGFAGNFGYADFTLSGPSMYALTERSHIHNGLYFDPSKIDKQGLAIAALSAGSDAGPVMMASSPGTGVAAPVVFIGGLSYTVIGAATDLVTDVIIPFNEALSNNNTTPAWEVIMVDGFTLGTQYAGGQVGGKAAPFVGPTYDVASALAPGFCWGTGCRE